MISIYIVREWTLILSSLSLDLPLSGSWCSWLSLIVPWCLSFSLPLSTLLTARRFRFLLYWHCSRRVGTLSVAATMQWWLQSCLLLRVRNMMRSACTMFGCQSYPLWQLERNSLSWAFCWYCPWLRSVGIWYSSFFNSFSSPVQNWLFKVIRSTYILSSLYTFFFIISRLNFCFFYI